MENKNKASDVYVWDGVTKGRKELYLTEPWARKSGAGTHRWRNFLDDLKEKTQDWTRERERR